MIRRLLCVLAVWTSVLMAATVGRADLLTPTGVTASQYADWGSGNRSPVGLLGTQYFTTDGDVSTWTLAATGGAAGQWQTDNVTVDQQWLLFDLGSPKSLSKAYLWNGAQSGLEGRGISGFEIWASDAAGNDLSRLTAAQALVLNQTADPSPAVTQPFELIGATFLQYVKIKIHSTWNGTATDYVTLGKIRFEGESPIPEPSTSILILLGMPAMLAYAWRKRKTISG